MIQVRSKIVNKTTAPRGKGFSVAGRAFAAGRSA